MNLSEKMVYEQEMEERESESERERERGGGGEQRLGQIP